MISVLQIVAKEVVLHDLDVPSALICFAVNNSIRNVVVGASAHSSFMRSFSATISCVFALNMNTFI